MGIFILISIVATSAIENLDHWFFEGWMWVN